jgi:osmotically-inducible protein OsmY
MAQFVRRMVMPAGVTPSRTVVWLIVSALLVGSITCRSTIATSEDATLQEEIADSLRRDHLDAIAVRVRGAKATLSGVASSAAERETAQRDAEQVDGIKAVTNNIRVGSP